MSASCSAHSSIGRILISNDDGIDAIGIHILEEIARSFSNDIWVIAPTDNRSGMSRAISLRKDVIIEPRGNNRFACSGTPSDCVIMGMARVMDNAPDLVLSGINAGMNVADGVLYSGTIAAAMEAALMGVPGIAFSQRNGGLDRVDYDAAIAHGVRVVQHILDIGIAERTVMNVNFPPVAADDHLHRRQRVL